MGEMKLKIYLFNILNSYHQVLCFKRDEYAKQYLLPDIPCHALSSYTSK